MRKNLLSLFVLLALVATSCNQPTQETPTADVQAAISTGVALTLIAQQALLPTATTPVELPPETATESVPEPTETATLAVTNTPAPTATLAVPMISASVNTNCRRGPSILFEPPVGVLAVGVTAEVRGRLSNNAWYLIQNPTRPEGECWVWSETTDIQGDRSAIPIATPPPMPPTPTFTSTPGVVFSAEFEEVHDCGGEPTAIFRIVNSGSVDLESLRLKIDDLTDDDTLYGPTGSEAPFMGSESECPPGGDTLPAGKTFFIGGAIGSGNSGHDARATIRLCSKDALDGICAEKTVNFDIP